MLKIALSGCCGRMGHVINDIVSGRRKLKGSLSFESILSVPAFAWARVHGKPENEYPHTTKYCYETMSNIEGWKGKTERED